MSQDHFCRVCGAEGLHKAGMACDECLDVVDNKSFKSLLKDQPQYTNAGQMAVCCWVCGLQRDLGINRGLVLCGSCFGQLAYWESKLKARAVV